MNSGPRVAVIGTGSFATALVRELAADAGARPQIQVIGRSVPSIRRLIIGAGGAPVQEIVAPLGLETDLTSCLEAVRPDLVVVCASLFSPSSATGPRPPGGGVAAGTLLQLPIAVRAAEAVAASGGHAKLVNACYPDVVNPLLAALELPVHFGLGSVQALAAGLRLPDLSMVAHHRHLTPVPTTEEALVWAPRLGPVHQRLNVLRSWPRRRLDDLGAATGGRLLAALLRGETIRTNLPGPGGLPGGYPVRVSLDRCEPDLPSRLTLDQAVAVNRRHGVAEGVDVGAAAITFTGATGRALDCWSVAPGGTLPVHDWEQAARRLISVCVRGGVELG